MRKVVYQSTVKVSAVGKRTEAQLLLNCALPHIDTERAERIRALLGEEIDWVYLVRKALQHGVMPLLYRSLSSTYPEAVPGAVLDQLRCHFQANAHSNLLLTGELLKLLDHLEAHGILAIPLKGPVLAVSTYGDLALRQFSDLDILVHPQHALRAKDLLLAHGYIWYSRPNDKPVLSRSHQQYHFVSRDEMVNVDLKWGVATREFRSISDLERLWGRLESVSFGGATVLQPAPDDLLLILCEHGFKHCWGRLQWVSDLAAFVDANHNRINWIRLIEDAQNLGARRLVLLGLLLVWDLLGLCLPEKVLARMRADSMTTSLATQIRERFFCDSQDPPGLHGSFTLREKCLFYIKGRERMRDKVHHINYFILCSARRLSIPNEMDHAFLPLPKLLSFLYYLIRPFRLFWQYGVLRFKHLRKRVPPPSNGRLRASLGEK